jgi:predicted dehydrogenase
MPDLNIAVIGAGIIGRTHVETLPRVAGLRLAAVVDPNAEAARLAEAHGAPWYADPGAVIEAGLADAAIIASPNDTHMAIAGELLRAGLPVLVEKPLAGSLAEGEALLRAEVEAGLPVLVGHHRRHNPIIKAAKAAIEAGRLGELVTATVMSTLAKPSAYFDVSWRRTPGAGGPLAINLIHEVDLLRHFWGEVAEVRAVTSNARRGFAVEDTAAAILTFGAGGIASVSVTDAGAGPWAWDVSAGENPARFPAHDVYAHAYAGTRAGLSLPDLALWSHPGAPDWTAEMTREVLPHTAADPYVVQLEHFAAVVRGEADPLVSAADGLANMRVIEAIRRAAGTGTPQSPQP